MYGTDRDDYRMTATGCGVSLIKKSHAISNPTRHFHPWWELLYIVSGERTFFYNNRTLHISAGTFLCIAPGILHRAINPFGEVCKLYNAFFADNDIPLQSDNPLFATIAPILQNCDPCIALSVETQQKVTELFTRMGVEYEHQEPGWQTMVWSYISEILVLVSRQKNVAGVAVQPTEAMNEHIAAIIDYINTHYSENITLSSIAQQFHLSPAYVSRAFKETTRFGFVEYITNLRITKSCRMLTDTNESILSIAMQCGFGSLTQFGRSFRALTGTNPLGYRKTNQR